MKTAFVTHQDCLKHITPPGHPECASRLQAVIERLNKSDFNSLTKIKAPLGKTSHLKLAHPAEYIKKIERLIPKNSINRIDDDTFLSPGSYIAALRGVGSIIKAIDLVMSQKFQNAFCATRPPGHHAEKTKSMGFCLFGNVAIGAKYLIKKYKLKRVVVIDFDVHHGNGTQDILWNETSALFISIHQMPLFPGTGYASETGLMNNIINLPLKSGSTGSEACTLFESVVSPKIKAFRPEFILVSAGFDAHTKDPLANLNWCNGDFAMMTRLILSLATEFCDKRVVSSLEGGYDIGALAESVASHVKVLMEA